MREDSSYGMMHTGSTRLSSQRNDGPACFRPVLGFTRVGVWYSFAFTTADKKSLAVNTMAGDHLRFPGYV